MKVLVAGAAGRVGLGVARRLALDGADLRLLVHTPTALNLPPDQDVVTANFNDAACMADVFFGVDAAFMYAPDPTSSKAVFRAAKSAGVRKVVLLSSASVFKAPPGANPIAERHRIAEDAVRDAGLEYVFIRPDTMASNCLQWAADIRTEGRVYTPYPESLRNPVHEDDLAHFAVTALRTDMPTDRAFHITGPQVVSIKYQVNCIAGHLGTAIECTYISEEEAVARLAQPPSKLPPLAALRLLEYLKKSVAVRPDITDDFAHFTGYVPRSFSDWVSDNLAAFRQSAAPDHLPAADQHQTPIGGSILKR